MKIIVCIKQVPEATSVKIDPQTKRLVREGVSAVINPFDLHALEAAIKLKEAYQAEVIAITMGPPKATKILKEAIAFGADKGVLLSDKLFAGSDSWATSYILAEAVKKVGGADLIICGKQAIDGDTAQVGPGVAAHLEIPQVTYVSEISGICSGNIYVNRTNEQGHDLCEVQLPALITVLKDLNQPRVPKLKGWLKADSSEITTLTANNLNITTERIGLKGSPTRVVKTFKPTKDNQKSVKIDASTNGAFTQIANEINNFFIAREA